MSYTNSDGLYVLTDEDQGEVNRSGGVTIGAVRKTLVFEVDDFTQLGTNQISFWNYQSGLAAGDAGINDPAPDAMFIPADSIILNSYIVMDAAATSGGSAVLNVGLYEKDGTAIDADGIDAGVAVAALTADAVIASDGALAVASNVGADDAYVGVDYDTAAFTAGSAKIVIEYMQVL